MEGDAAANHTMMLHRTLTSFQLQEKDVSGKEKEVVRAVPLVVPTTVLQDETAESLLSVLEGRLPGIFANLHRVAQVSSRLHVQVVKILYEVMTLFNEFMSFFDAVCLNLSCLVTLLISPTPTTILLQSSIASRSHLIGMPFLEGNGVRSYRPWHSRARCI